MILSIVCVTSIRGMSHLMLLYHQQYLFDVIKMNIKEAQYISVDQSRPVTLTLNENHQLSRCIESVCSEISLGVRYHLKISYRGFPQHRIQFDRHGLLLGNGRFTVTHPRLEKVQWVLNHHARLRQAQPDEIH